MLNFRSQKHHKNGYLELTGNSNEHTKRTEQFQIQKCISCIWEIQYNRRRKQASLWKQISRYHVCQFGVLKYLVSFSFSLEDCYFKKNIAEVKDKAKKSIYHFAPLRFKMCYTKRKQNLIQEFLILLVNYIIRSLTLTYKTSKDSVECLLSVKIYCRFQAKLPRKCLTCCEFRYMQKWRLFWTVFKINIFFFLRTNHLNNVHENFRGNSTKIKTREGFQIGWARFA
jgi:hypothetical protein